MQKRRKHEKYLRVVRCREARLITADMEMVEAGPRFS